MEIVQIIEADRTKDHPGRQQFHLGGRSRHAVQSRDRASGPS
jgi:hypothetical protein